MFQRDPAIGIGPEAPSGDGAWMGVLLALHLGVVMALFLTIPYGKFAHGFYRCAALLKWAIEKRRGSHAADG